MRAAKNCSDNLATRRFTTLAGIPGHASWHLAGARVECACGAKLADRGQLAAHVDLARLGVAA